MFYYFIIRLSLLRKCVLKSCVLIVTHFWQLRFLAITSTKLNENMGITPIVSAYTLEDAFLLSPNIGSLPLNWGILD
jgi:hypothetical protein